MHKSKKWDEEDIIEESRVSCSLMEMWVEEYKIKLNIVALRGKEEKEYCFPYEGENFFLDSFWQLYNIIK